MQFELCLKTYQDITEVVSLLKEFKIQSLCLADKPNLIQNIQVAEKLLSLNSELEITINFAVANHFFRDVNIYQEFEKLVSQASLSCNINKFLVISGSQKKSINSLNIFQHITSNLLQNKFYCSYNPYFDEENQQLENYRLAKKIATGNVNGVYLQIGLDLFKLQQGIKFIRSLNVDIKVYGCLLIPNSQILNSLKFRPWKGVFLGFEYLNNLDYAVSITKQIQQIYLENNVLQLVEIAPFNHKNIFDFTKNYATL